ncbi:ABC transporter permease [Pseudohoeflea coraliihabitans]|uniref:ABC transporter permease n=1 Tax=Pseudohoeflea coraliihabitans TaxID=2860393 RepID=A0ABS6WTN1_9HYPH|nr:ABC transporter permease [Pseudohoeflea sp. DP4N28-3]MBW3098988.1 ABC transporter permease [Pseudohoeflea sp. DP4N28-3]
MTTRTHGTMLGRREDLGRYAIFLVLVGIYLAGLAASSAFGDPKYLFNMVRQVTPVGIAAIGVTLVMILGGVDLSIGAVISLTSVLCASLMAGDAANLHSAILLTLAAGLVIGAMNGALIAFSRVSPFILTLGMGVAIVGLTQIYSGGTAKGIVSPGFREFFNHRMGGSVPVLTLAFFVLLGLGLLIEKCTVFGRQVFLIGSNRSAALLSGLPIRAVTMATYSLSGLFGAFAGIALLARSGVSSTSAGQGLEFQVLAAVVLGGTTFEGGRGGITGTLAGVLILVIAFNLVNIGGLPYHMQLVVMGTIIILASALHGWLSRTSS